MGVREDIGAGVPAESLWTSTNGDGIAPQLLLPQARARYFLRKIASAVDRARFDEREPEDGRKQPPRTGKDQSINYF